MTSRLQNLVIIDVETTGIDPRNDEVTSLAMVPLDLSIPTFEAFVRTPDTLRKLNGTAESYFDRFRADWSRQALPPLDVWEAVENYVSKHFSDSITLVGHNVGFDIAFLRNLASMAGAQLPASISHRGIDTHTLLYLLHLTGEIGKEALSSSGAFQAFGVECPSRARHTSLGDAKATRLLFLALLERFEERLALPIGSS